MRIAIIHSYYSSSQPSGENVAVDSQAALLREAGHKVAVIAQRTDDRERHRLYPLRAGLTVATKRGPSPIRQLRTFQPDVVHLHNLFPNWGTRWLAEWHGPVVATLHNFRALCAAGTLFRDGKVCTLCPDGTPRAAVTYGCYHGSTVQTLPLAWRNRRGPSGDDVIRRADQLVVLAERARDLYARYGVPTDRMTLVPNFVEDLNSSLNDELPNDRWVFVGRLFPEKGVVEMLSHWPVDQPLDVVGDGPLTDAVQRALPIGSRLLGPMNRSELRQSLPQYTGLVLPSRWPESAEPLVMIEALAAGLPVVALNGSSAADLVAERTCGVVVRDDSDWAAALTRAMENRGTLASNARQTYLDQFQPSTWLSSMLAVYEQAITTSTAV